MDTTSMISKGAATDLAVTWTLTIFSSTFSVALALGCEAAVRAFLLEVKAQVDSPFSSVNLCS